MRKLTVVMLVSGVVEGDWRFAVGISTSVVPTLYGPV